MELELGLPEVQGGPSLGGAPPELVAPGPPSGIFTPVFFVYSIEILCKFLDQSGSFYFCTKTTPWQFYRKQRQSGLVPFKSCKLESKTRAKEFGKVDMMETYQLPQA